MQRNRRETLELLLKRRQEMDALKRGLSSEGGEFSMVGSFSRNRFDQAVSSRGEAPPAPLSAEEAALFYKPVVPSWSAEPPSVLTTPRPHSVSLAARTRVPPSQGQAAAKARPDSEPPNYGSSRRSNLVAQGHRAEDDTSQLQHHRRMNPEIRRLVQHYNSGLRVLCGQPPGQCGADGRHTNYSVASGFYLIPMKQEEVKEEDAEEKVSERDTEAECAKEEEIPVINAEHASSHASLQHGENIENQLLELPSTGRANRWSAIVSKVISSGFRIPEEVSTTTNDNEEEIEIPWRSWVDDATVSTVHSHSSQKMEELEEADEPEAVGTMVGNTLNPDMPNSKATLRTSKSRLSKAAPASASDPGSKVLTPPPPPQPEPAEIPKKGGGGGKKGSKNKKSDLSPIEPSPALPPEEEPPLVVEDVVECVEEEPEPMPPPYICPSSESKSHDVELRRWLRQSPFRSANRTMPIL